MEKNTSIWLTLGQSWPKEFTRKMPKNIDKNPKVFFDFARVNRPYLGSSDRAFNRTNKAVMTEKTCQPRTMEKNWLLGSQVYIYIYDVQWRPLVIEHCYGKSPLFKRWIIELKGPWLSIANCEKLAKGPYTYLAIVKFYSNSDLYRFFWVGLGAYDTHTHIYIHTCIHTKVVIHTTVQHTHTYIYIYICIYTHDLFLVFLIYIYMTYGGSNKKDETRYLIQCLDNNFYAIWISIWYILQSTWMIYGLCLILFAIIFL